LIELEPDACFGGEEDGRLVATATLLSHGAELAWIGMVLTHADYQRRGFARTLMNRALETARFRGIRSIKLDATDQGRPLYASLGFNDEQPVERWYRPATSGAETRFRAGGEIRWGLDRQAFGADRSRFLRSLGPPDAATAEGYVMSRPGARARYLGPCVARTADTAAELIASVLTGEAWFWDLLPRNAAAKELALAFGFEPARHLVRMRFGESVATREDRVFALAGFEAG
jgi:hypothetical protein